MKVRRDAAALLVAPCVLALVVTAASYKEDSTFVWAVVALLFGIGGVALVRRLALGVRTSRYDPFFAIYAGSAAVYLQVAPALIVGLGGRLPDAPSPGEYAFFMGVGLVCFLAPLMMAYRVVPLRGSPGNAFRAVGGADLAALIGATLGALYLWLVVTTGLFRRVGARAGSDQVIGLSNATTAVQGVFEDSALFLVAVVVFAIHRATPRRQQFLTRCLIVISAAYLIPAAVNSRLDAAVFLINFAAWWHLSRRKPMSIYRWLKSGLLVAVLVFAAFQVALNARQIVPAAVNSGESPIVRLYSPFGDNAGLNRIDCVNTLGRIGPTMSDPQGFAGWGAVGWQVRRYIDRPGFDEFRRSLDTSVKDYYVRRYISPDAVDYYSCSIVETMGGFSIPGLLITGALFGVAFGLIRRTLLRPTNVRRLLLAMFFACWWLRFEKGLSVLLFGWLNALPFLLLLLWRSPFRRVSGDPAQCGVRPSKHGRSRRVRSVLCPSELEAPSSPSDGEQAIEASGEFRSRAGAATSRIGSQSDVRVR